MEKEVECIVCPVDKAKLIDKESFWQCAKCNAKYKINNGIPNLLIEDSEQNKSITKNE